MPYKKDMPIKLDKGKKKQAAPRLPVFFILSYREAV